MGDDAAASQSELTGFCEAERTGQGYPASRRRNKGPTTTGSSQRCTAADTQFTSEGWGWQIKRGRGDKGDDTKQELHLLGGSSKWTRYSSKEWTSNSRQTLTIQFRFMIKKTYGELWAKENGSCLSEIIWCASGKDWEIKELYVYLEYQARQGNVDVPLTNKLETPKHWKCKNSNVDLMSFCAGRMFAFMSLSRPSGMTRCWSWHFQRGPVWKLSSPSSRTATLNIQYKTLDGATLE